MSDITRQDNYEEFTKECKFFFCQYIYEGDWDGKEKYIVASDTPEEELLKKYPTIMKRLSPYMFCNAECGKVYSESANYINKHSKRIANMVYFGDEVGEEFDFPMESFVEKYMDKEVLKDSMNACTKIQREYINLHYVMGVSIREISIMYGRHEKTVQKVIYKGLATMREMLLGGMA